MHLYLQNTENNFTRSEIDNRFVFNRLFIYLGMRAKWSELYREDYAISKEIEVKSDEFLSMTERLGNMPDEDFAKLFPEFLEEGYSLRDVADELMRLYDGRDKASDTIYLIWRD